MEREQWLEERRKGIGGSDIAAVCGLSRWKGPMDVYLDKIGATPPTEANEAMYWGTKMEVLLRERFEAEHPELHIWVPQKIAVHPSYPFALGNYDGLCFQREVGADGQDVTELPSAGWEAKTASAFKREEWAGDTPPLEYVYQCQWYMGISGLHDWYLSVLIGGNDYREWLIERDDVIIQMLLDRAVEFWELVESLTPPPIDGSDVSTNVLNALYPAAEAVLDPPAQLESCFDEEAAAYLAAKQTVKEAEDTMNFYANRLKERLGDSAVGVTPGGFEIDWKPRQRTSIDTKRLRDEHPDIAAEYSKPAEFRVFSVKQMGGAS